MLPKNLPNLPMGETEIPSDVVINDLMKFLTTAEAGKVMRASTTLYTLFNSPAAWMKRIEKDFQIPFAILSEFANDYRLKMHGAEVNFEFIYHQLRRVTQVESRLPEFLKFSYRNQKFYFQLLTCCQDNIDYARITLPPSEIGMWVVLALFAGLKHIPNLVDEFLPQRLLAYFDFAIEAGDILHAKRLYSKLEETGRSRTGARQIQYAAKSGSVPLLEWLLEQQTMDADVDHSRSSSESESASDSDSNIDEDEQENLFDEDTYICGAQSGRREMLEFINTKGNPECTEHVLMGLINSGNLETIVWFCNTYYNLPFEQDGFPDLPFARMLAAAVSTGSVEFLTQLLKKINLSNDVICAMYCMSAAAAGSVELLKFVLQASQSSFLQNRETYKTAALEGNELPQQELLCLKVIIADGPIRKS